MSSIPGPYYKVYSKRVDGREVEVSVEEVQAALPDNIEGLIVDDMLGYPAVNFPASTTGDVMRTVKQHLESQGFLPY